MLAGARDDAAVLSPADLGPEGLEGLGGEDLPGPRTLSGFAGVIGLLLDQGLPVLLMKVAEVLGLVGGEGPCEFIDQPAAVAEGL